MRALVPIVAIALLAILAGPSSAAIDKLQREDFPNFAIGMARLYYNVGKGVFQYVKTVIVSAPNLPKGIAVDVFNVGQKAEPAYYLTKKERRERDRQKRMESRLEEQRRREEEAQGGGPLTTIKP